MTTVDVQDQPRLPLRRCVELVLSGVRFRLFRAAVTVAIIALAVAFLMTMLSESLIALRVARAVDRQTAPRRLLLQWVARISTPYTPALLTAELGGELTPERRREFAAWGNLSKPQIDRLARVARDQLRYEAFFHSLSEGQRAQLLGQARGKAVFDRMQSAKLRQAFFTKLHQLGKSLPAGGDESADRQADFEQFVKDYHAAADGRSAILAGHAARLKKTRALLKTRADGQATRETPEELFASADAELPARLAACDMYITAKELATVREQAALRLDAQKIKDLLGLAILKQRLATRQNRKVADVSALSLFEEVRTDSGATWLLGLIDQQRGKLRALRASQAKGKELAGEDRSLLAAANMLEGFRLSKARIRQVADERISAAELSEVEATVSQTTGETGWLGFSPRTIALLAVSFLVCIVGIANAMLMSVSERFREIATMKCLGATDGFIMINFILESCLQGVAGGMVGVFLGFLLGLLRSSVNYGWIAMAHLPIAAILLAAALSIAAGVLISALAAVYPAWVAARLAPLEAMRIE